MRNYGGDHKAPRPASSRGRRALQRLLDLRLDQGLEVLLRDRADQLVDDARIAIDEKILRHPVHAPLDGSAAVEVGAGGRKRIAVAAEETARVLRLILVVDSGDPDAIVL